MSFGGGGPMFGGGRGSASSPGGGLPFAGVPTEMQAGVNRLLADEPEHAEPDARFSYLDADARSKNLNLRQLIFRHWRVGVMAVVLV
ncbi:MAG: ABC transporter ATP-binding protein, partial [Solirubrobacteraceae bacterium]